MLDVKDAARKLLKEYSGMKITKAYDHDDKYVFSIMPKNADVNKGWIDGFQSVDKRSGEINPYSPIMDKEGFKKALKHPIDLAKE